MSRLIEACLLMLVLGVLGMLVYDIAGWIGSRLRGPQPKDDGL